MKAKELTKLKVLDQVEDLVKSRMKKVEPVMDDYDGGQKAAYITVLNDIKIYRSIINHTNNFSGQEEPGMDY